MNEMAGSAGMGLKKRQSRFPSGLGPPRAYAIAFIATAIALSLRLLLGPVLEGRLLLVLFVPAVLVASGVGGLGARPFCDGSEPA